MADCLGLRLTTSPRVFPRPLSAERALSIVREWTALSNVALVQPGPRHLELLHDLAVNGQATGTLFSDAVLAALAIE